MQRPASGYLLVLWIAVVGIAVSAAEETSMPQSIDSGLFVASGAEVRSFTKEAVIEAPAAKVYDAWATPEGWSEVYDPPSASNIDLAIGGRYEWLFDGKIGSNGCQVLSYIPGRMISFSWSAPPSQPENRGKRTWVVVEVEPLSADRTKVRLTHLGFGEGTLWDETYDYFVAAWGRVLQGMGESLGK